MYRCNYCHENHADETVSQEHIIPNMFGNKSYVLNNVCRRNNNYMAISFEKNLLRQTLFIEIRKLLGMINNSEMYMGKVQTESGNEHDRWSIKGQDILRTIPVVESTSLFMIDLRDSAGNILPYPIALPPDIELTTKVTGAAELIKEPRIQTRIQDTRTKLLDYLNRLYADPSLDAALQKYMTENQYTMIKPKDIDVSINRQTISPDEIVADIKPQLLEYDPESMIKLLLKIAWTHACQQLGSAALDNPIGNFIRSYVLRGHIDTALGEYEKSVLEQLIREENVAGTILYFWKLSPDRTLQELSTLFSQWCIIPSTIMRSATQRLYDLAETAHITKYTVQNLTPEMRANIAQYKHHELQIEDIERGNKKATICKITLFGGLITGSVQISVNPIGRSSEYKVVRLTF